MRVREISVPDVQRGKFWRVVCFDDEDDWLNWEIVEARRIRAVDVIVHQTPTCH
jgi:hypothetical protein